MPFTRTSIPDFALANPLYAGATVTIYEVNDAGVKTATLASLYESPTTATLLANPQTLDGEGKWQQPVYIDTPVIASVSGLTIADHDTGVVDTGGTFRGSWATAQVYYPNDVLRDGVNGDGTLDLYIIVNQHTSGAWATDKADATRMLLALDASAITALASLPDPAAAAALDFLRVNAAKTGYEFRSAAEVRALLWTKGADIASATTLVLGSDGNYFNVTGTTPVTALTTIGVGARVLLQPTDALPFTHHATNLILTGGVSRTLAAGDHVELVEYATGQFKEIGFADASSLPIVADTPRNLTAGFTATAFDAGTKTTGTYTPAPSDGNFQRYANGGAHTLAPPSATGDYTIIIQVTNNGSAGALTTSGFTNVTGDTPSTTSGDDFLFYITKLNGFTHLHVVALQ